MALDLTVYTEAGILNVRVAALIMEDGYVLFEKFKELCALPGGRVHYGEDFESAIKRELKEELDVEIESLQPIWLNQSFFTAQANVDVHEFCLYFAVTLKDNKAKELRNLGDEFTLNVHEEQHFVWFKMDELAKRPCYPLFLAKEINNLPTAFTLHVEHEDDYE